jgi:hypothetical protein
MKAATQPSLRRLRRLACARSWPLLSNASMSLNARSQVYAVCASLTARRSAQRRDQREAGTLDQVPCP